MSIVNKLWPKMKKLESFSLMEILVTCVILSILVTLSIAHYGPMQEKVYDREAQKDVRLMHLAQKMYHLDFGTYYPAGPTPEYIEDTATINTNLKLVLPTDNSKWTYTTDDNGCVEAERNNATVLRSWHMLINDTEPQAGTACIGS